MKTLLGSDWLKAVQLLNCNSVQKCIIPCHYNYKTNAI